MLTGLCPASWSEASVECHDAPTVEYLRHGVLESQGPKALVHVLVDHSALTRGSVEEGERCEIRGVGPVSAATARALASDAILRALVTDGTDIKTVSHPGRSISANQRTALVARDAKCVVPSVSEPG